jgi:hypothetical protein
VTSPQEEGVGCRTVSLVLVTLLAFAAVAAFLGITLIDSGCTGVCERVAFSAYGAGLPVSALFTVLTANDLVVAFLTDLILWIVLAVWLTRIVERRGLVVWKPALAAMGGASLYGVVIGLLLARA